MKIILSALPFHVLMRLVGLLLVLLFLTILLLRLLLLFLLGLLLGRCWCFGRLLVYGRIDGVLKVGLLLTDVLNSERWRQVLWSVCRFGPDLVEPLRRLMEGALRLLDFFVGYMAILRSVRS